MTGRLVPPLKNRPTRYPRRETLEHRIKDAFDRATLPRVGEAEEAGALNDYGFDESFLMRSKPVFEFMYRRYWRIESRGVEHVPADGPAILVGNHSGGLPFDAMMVGYAVTCEEAGPKRPTRPLYDKFVENMPGVRSLYRRLGGAPASYAVADELLGRGQAVALFPEGVRGVAKTFDDRYRLGSFSTSAARLSYRHRVPIVPFAVVGAEETYPMISRSETLGKAIGAPYVPITPFFPFMGAFGLLPLPTRWTIVFGPRIHLYRERRFRGAGCMDFDAMTERLHRTVDLHLRAALDRRSSIFLG